MRYVVSRRTIDSPGSLDITEKQFRDTKNSQLGLIESVSIEDKFNILCKNYFEFEKELLEIRLSNALFKERAYSASQDEIFDVERRVINLFTASRLFIDQVSRMQKSRYGGSAHESFKRKTSEVYDSTFGYRVVEALRNWVQHRGLIISTLTLRASKDNKMIKSTITPSLNVSRIKEVGGLKASVLKELESRGENFDLKPIIREAMEGFARVHEYVRSSWSSDVTLWENTISEIRKRYTDAFFEGDFPLAVTELDDAGEPTDSFLVFDELIQRRRSLVTRNRTDLRYNSQVITNETSD